MRLQRRVVPVLALLLPVSAMAVVCDPDPDRFCPEVPVAKSCVSAREPSCTTGAKALDFAYNVPPPPAETQIVCDYTSNRYNCEAWPKYGGLTYSWSKSGSLNFVNPPYLDDTAAVTCSAGANNILYLTVTSKYGLSTTTTAHLYCGYLGEY